MREIFSPTSRRIKRNLLLQRGAHVLGARLRGRSNGQSSAGIDVYLDVAHATCSLAAVTASTAVSHSKVRGSRAYRSRVRFDSARAVFQSLARDVDAQVVARATGVSSTPRAFSAPIAENSFLQIEHDSDTKEYFQKRRNKFSEKILFFFLFTFFGKQNASAVFQEKRYLDRRREKNLLDERIFAMIVNE